MSTTTTATLARKIRVRSSDQGSKAVATDLKTRLDFCADTLTADEFTQEVQDIAVDNEGRSITATWHYTGGTTAKGETIAIQLEIRHNKDRKVYTATSRLVTRDGIFTRIVIAFDPESPFTPHKIKVDPAPRFSRTKFTIFATEALELVTGGASPAFLRNASLAPRLAATS